MDQLAQSVNFENLLESNKTLLPKEDLFLMTCSTSVKSTKIIKVKKYLFQELKQSYSTQFLSKIDLWWICYSGCN
jgi:hypothetical protein